jgi:hypothetical protein
MTSDSREKKEWYFIATEIGNDRAERSVTL